MLYRLNTTAFDLEEYGKYVSHETGSCYLYLVREVGDLIEDYLVIAWFEPMNRRSCAALVTLTVY